MSADFVDPGLDDPANNIHEAHAFFRRAIRGWSREGAPAPQQLIERFDALRIVVTSLLYTVSINLEAGDDAQVSLRR